MTTNDEYKADRDRNNLIFSGCGVTIIFPPNSKPLFFDANGLEISEIEKRVEAQEKLIIPTIEAMKNSWQQTLRDFAAVSQKLKMMSVKFNDDQPDYTQGDFMEDGSYYMGVDELSMDFFLFIDSIGMGKHADVVSFNEGTEILQKKQRYNEKFHGHKFSNTQIDGVKKGCVKNAIKRNVYDGGLYRPRQDQGKLIEETFKMKSCLRDAAIDICKVPMIQTSTMSRKGNGLIHDLRDGWQGENVNQSEVSLLVGYSKKHLTLNI